MSIFNSAYSQQETFFKDIPGFKQRQEIDPACWSARGNGSSRFYSPGIGLATAMFLTGELSISATPDRSVIAVEYFSKSQGKVRIESVLEGGTYKWKDQGSKAFAHPASSGAMALACGLLLPETFPDTHRTLRALTDFTGFPLSTQDLLNTARQNPTFKTLIHTLIDHLYSEVTSEIASRTILVGESPQQTQGEPHALSVTDVQANLGLSVLDDTEQETPMERIMRLMERGGAALLVGPPGTFKTTTVRKATVKKDSNIVEMRGSPGVEDRDLFGTFMRTASGHVEWVDGPLPRAFSLARDKPTVALVDEVLRFLPETTNVFITVLNELDYEDCVLLLRPALLASGVTPEQLETELSIHLPEKAERYYMLTLPTGESMFALKRNLTFLFTTNWGDDHLQVASALDAALESRMEMIIEVERAERDIVLPIYEQLAGPHANLAAFAIEIEDETHRQMDDAEGLFRRPLDPRKVIAFIKDARALIERGLSFKSAVLRAANHTLVPHVCPRESNGRLTAPAVERINEIIVKDVLPRTSFQ